MQDIHYIISKCPCRYADQRSAPCISGDYIITLRFYDIINRRRVAVCLSQLTQLSVQFAHRAVDRALLFVYNSDIPTRKEAFTMKNTDAKNKGRFSRGFDLLLYAMTAFLALGCEAVLAFGIEQNLYHCTIKDFTPAQSIIHWVLTYIIWGLFAFYICRSTKKKGYDLFPENTGRIRPWQWVCIVIGVAVCLVSTWIDWHGSKVLTELDRKGPLLFVFQYIYYFIEVFLVMLIIVCGQRACEVWFGRENIPYGGIIAALTWGLGHWMTKDSLAAGLFTAFCGLMLGSMYLLANRKSKLTYLLLCIIFIL